MKFACFAMLISVFWLQAQTDSIQNYLNSRAKKKSGYMEKGNNVTTSIMETNIGDDSDTVTDNNEGKR